MAEKFRTQINGKDAEWSALLWMLWYTFADATDPKWKDVTVSSANYYTPRPYVDEYNRGNNKAGFTYILQPGNKVAYVQWNQRSMMEVMVPDHYVEKLLAERTGG